jgi:tetratricopeptide (TPR) repeat protein
MTKDDLLEKYFNQPLSLEEEGLLKQWLAEDADFAENFAFEKQLRAAIHTSERATLKNKLAMLEQQPKVVPMIQKKWWYMAAACLFAIILSTIFLFQKPDLETLYAEYYTAYPNVVAPIVRGNTTSVDSITLDAFIMYEKKEFEKASVKFEQIYKTSNAPFAAFYHGICLQETQKINESIIALQKITSTDREFYLPSQWYIALAYIKSNKPQKALPLLQIVAQSEHPLHTNASALFKKLKSYE